MENSVEIVNSWEGNRRRQKTNTNKKATIKIMENGMKIRKSERREVNIILFNI